MIKTFILLFFFTQSTWAKKKQRDFFESIHWNTPWVSYQELTQTWQKFSSKHTQGSYLSLGESHLYPRGHAELLNKVYEDFQIQKYSSRLCTETISWFLSHSIFEKIKNDQKSIFLSKRNSPSFTDFADCRVKEQEPMNYLLYSGFFHQMPLARLFPRTLQASTISKTPGQTIVSQMYKLPGMFITFMDLPFMVKSRTIFILKHQVKNIRKFKRSANKLLSSLEQIRLKMQKMHFTHPEDQLLYGILSKKNLPKIKNFPSNLFIFLKDYPHETNQNAGLIKSMLTWKDSELQQVLKFLKGSKLYLSKLHLERSLDGNSMTRVGYGTLKKNYPYYTSFLVAMKNKKRVLFVFQPATPYPTCMVDKEEISFSECLLKL